MFLIEKLNIRKKLNKGGRVFFGTLLLGVGVTLTGCSLGKSRDENVLNTPNYRKVNTACAKMDLSKSTVDVKTFRAIVECFNAYGALEPVQGLLKSLSDEDLQPLVTASNRYILSSPQTLYKLKESHYSLVRNGHLDNSFKHLGNLLRKDLVTSSLALMKDGYAATSSTAKRSSGRVLADEDLLKAIEVLGSKMSPSLIQETLNLGLNVVGSRSFHDFQKLIAQNAEAKLLRLPSVAIGLHRYFQMPHTYACDKEHPEFEIRNDLITAILDGSAFALVDEVLGADAEKVKTKVADINFVLTQMLTPTVASDEHAGGALLMEQMISAVQKFNQPISCINGSQEVPNAARYLLDRLATLSSSAESTDYILSTAVRELFLLKPVCELPVETNKHFQSMIEVARTGAMPPLVDVIKALHGVKKEWKGCGGKNKEAEGEYRPLLSLFVNLLGDLGGPLPDQGATEPTAPILSWGPAQSSGLKDLLPLLTSITKDDLWPELLLVSAVPGDHDRANTQAALKFLAEPEAKLSQKSVIDVLATSLSKASYKHLFDFARAVLNFMEDPAFKDNPGLVEEILTNLRNLLLVNNVNPWVELLRDNMRDATKNAALYETLFKISDRPEFSDSIELIATMAKDGRLKELTEAVVLLFQKFADQAKDEVAVRDLPIPAFKAQRRHDLTRIDLTKPNYKPVPRSAPDALPTIADSCGKLNLDFSIADTGNKEFGAQLKYFLDCQGDAGLTSALTLLNEQKTSEGRDTYFQLMVKMMQQAVSNPDYPTAVLDQGNMKYLMSRWWAAYNDGSLFRLMDAAPYWVGNGATWSSSNTIVTPVFRLIHAIMDSTQGPLLNAREAVREVGQFAAQVIRKPDFSKLLADLEDLSEKLKPELKPDTPSLDCSHYPSDAELADTVHRKDWAHLPSRRLVADWVRVKECNRLEKYPSEVEKEIFVNQRVDEIYRETCEARTNLELLGVSDAKSRRTEWTQVDLQDGNHSIVGVEGALHAHLDPLLEAFTDSSRSLPDHWIGDEQLAFLKEKTPEDILGFLYPRALDYRLITHVFPGETYPRVMLANTLDLLEIVLNSTDMVAKLPPVLEATLGKLLPKKNLGLDFLLEIAYAWGDEPSEKWPADIPNYWKVHRRPQTLLEAVKDITHRANPTENLSTLSYYVVGLTKVPACNKNKIYPDPQSGWGAGALIGGELGDDFRRRLYNIWQVAIVLEENAPGSGIGYNGGLEFLRDLFYRIVQSTPAAYRYSEPKDHNYERNNLSVVLRSVKMGAFRQLGRVLREYSPNSKTAYAGFQRSLDQVETFLLNGVEVSHLPEIAETAKNMLPADRVLRDFFTTVVRTANAPEAGKTLRTFLEVGSDHAFFWKFLDEVFGALDESPKVAATLKKTAYYGFADLNRIQSWPTLAGETDLMTLLIHQLDSILLSDGAYLFSHPTLLKDLLRAKETGKLAQNFYGVNWESDAKTRVVDLARIALSDYPKGSSPVMNAFQLYKAVDGNPAAKRAWDQLKPMYDQLQAQPGYADLKVDELAKGVLHFFQEKGEYSEDSARAASEKLRQYMAFQLESGNLAEWLDLVKDKPEETYQLLKTLSTSMTAKDEGLRKFLAMIEAGLSGPKH